MTISRYVTEGNQENPDWDSSFIKEQLHAMLSHWMAAGMHWRDFPMAALEATDDAFEHYWLEKEEILSRGAYSPTMADLLPLAPFPAKRPAKLKRLFNAAGKLNVPARLNEKLNDAMWVCFGSWLSQGFLPREFPLAIFDYASSEMYEFTYCFAEEGDPLSDEYVEVFLTNRRFDDTASTSD